jgi:hypothetical protein
LGITLPFFLPYNPTLLINNGGSHIEVIVTLFFHQPKERGMKSKRLSVLLAVAALVVSTLACSFGNSEPSLTNPRMSTDSDGNNTTTSYSPNDTFYAVADLSNVKTGSVADAKWYLVSAEDYEAGEIESSSLTIEDASLYNYVSFELASTDPWPAGEYKVELYLNGVLAHTINFSVQ